jgi:hypothetical protein
MHKYTDAQYDNGWDGNSPNSGINVHIDGFQSYVPCVVGNTDYTNIMQLVESGNLIIKPADEANN